MHAGIKPRGEKKNHFEDFTVLFAGSYVYINDKAYPLGELTAELLNYPDEKLIDLRYTAEMMLVFAEDEFYNPETTKDLALAQAMRDKINKVLEIIYDMPMFDKLVLDRDADFHMLPILWKEDDEAFRNSTIMGTEENVRFQSFIYRMATLADETLSFKVYVTAMLDIYFEKLRRRASEHYAVGVYRFFSDTAMHMEIAASLPPTPFVFFKQARSAEIEYTTLPDLENIERYMIGEQMVFHDYVSFFHVDLFRGLMHGNTPRRCQNCGRYFLLANSYDAVYCNRVAPGETVKTCRKVGAHRKSAKGEGKPPAQKMYDTVYNRLKQRHLRKKISHDEWNAAVVKALEYKDKAERGELSDQQLKALYDEM
ncbi:hypothetical protein FACS1894191_7220 [Clostridia bacterium]|nr:hypothetical protein FACS1894191_7220 [Clostridia bacterium]